MGASVKIGMILIAMVGAQLSLADAGIEFFEREIRPLLVDNCGDCHNAKKQKGGLELDTPAGIRFGGDSGPVLIPGQPVDSPIMRAVRRVDHDTAMPPKNPLPQAQVDLLAKWVRMGAPMPESRPQTARRRGYDWQEASEFWAFAAPRKATPPEADDGSVIRDDLDRFVVSKRKEAGLVPSQAADKRTLIRRATFDLIGLPPTPKEIASFLADDTPEAFEHVVDRLLGNPQFGVRWARHWLDVARYGDDQAYAFAQKKLDQAWQYRDWVVEAFNHDLPYDAFIRRQLAADLMPDLPPSELRATGLISTGPMYFKRTEVQKALADEVDDRIDVVTRGFLGLTVACARCHDHKFDPVPTADYYALSGIFRSTRIVDRYVVEPEVVTAYHNALYKRPKQKAAALRYRLAAWEALQPRLADSLTAALLPSDSTSPSSRMELSAAVVDDLRSWLAKAGGKDGSTLVRKLRQSQRSEEVRIVDDREGEKIGKWANSTFFKSFHGKGYVHDGNDGKGKRSIRFQLPVSPGETYQLYLGYNYNNQRSEAVPVTVRHAGGKSTVKINQQQRPEVDGLWSAIGTYRFDNPHTATVTVSNEGTKGFVIVDGIRLVRVGGASRAVEPARQDVLALAAAVSEKLAAIPKNIVEPIFETNRVTSHSADHRQPIYVALNGARKLWLVTWNESTNRYKFNYNAWLNPELSGPDGTVKVTDLEPERQTALAGELVGSKYDVNEDAIIVNGEVLVHGIQNVGTTVYEYRLPEGTRFDSLTAEGGVFNKNGGGVKHNKARFLVFAESPDGWLAREAALVELRGLLGDRLVLSDKAVRGMLSAADLEGFDEVTAGLREPMKKRPPVVHALMDGAVRNQSIHVRGNPKKFGDEVSRGYLTVLSPNRREGRRLDFGRGSGRLELANAIADSANPLTARVMANRIWHHLFGAGLVRTPSNFGVLGERPTHPELLDHLAVRFMENGWSIKALIRTIMLSGTYQLSADANTENQENDPENRLLWRQNLKRLDLEAYRDATMAVSGELDARIDGGPVGASLVNASNRRRTLYAKVSRTNPDGTRLTFDFPSANAGASKRAVTTVPQQKLFALNSHFIAHHARQLARRLSTIKDADARLSYAYQLLYAREPSAREIAVLGKFADSATDDPWPYLAQILLIANEFQYID